MLFLSCLEYVTEKKNTRIQQQGNSVGELCCLFTRHGLTVVLLAA